MLGAHRHRGAAIIAAAPATPPGMRVRTGRFEKLRSPGSALVGSHPFERSLQVLSGQGCAEQPQPCVSRFMSRARRLRR